MPKGVVYKRPSHILGADEHVSAGGKPAESKTRNGGLPALDTLVTRLQRLEQQLVHTNHVLDTIATTLDCGPQEGNECDKATTRDSVFMMVCRCEEAAQHADQLALSIAAKVGECQ